MKKYKVLASYGEHRVGVIDDREVVSVDAPEKELKGIRAAMVGAVIRMFREAGLKTGHPLLEMTEDLSNAKLCWYVEEYWDGKTSLFPVVVGEKTSIVFDQVERKSDYSLAALYLGPAVGIDKPVKGSTYVGKKLPPVFPSAAFEGKQQEKMRKVIFG